MDKFLSMLEVPLPQQEDDFDAKKYDKMTSAFLRLYETLGYIMVRGDPQEHFLDYGFYKRNSKILHSH